MLTFLEIPSSNTAATLLATNKNMIFVWDSEMRERAAPLTVWLSNVVLWLAFKKHKPLVKVT
jgi:hypothetical protein